MNETDDFDAYLRSAFPAATDGSVIRAVREAVVLADDLRSNTHWLQSLVGSDLAGMLRRAAIMWRLHDYCKTGDLPFRADEIPNSNGSSHLLRIVSGPFEAHVVRTDSPGAFPDDAPIRQDRALRNEGDLFDDPKIVPFSEMVAAVKQAYAWLSFNATQTGVLTHVCWCMPKAKERGYLARLNILRVAQTAGVPNTPTEPPKPDPTERMKFKRHIEDQIERSKNNKHENKGGK